MLPRPPPPSGPNSSQPRARGDAPLSLIGSGSSRSSVPRTRGCSDVAQVAVRRAMVSPAHAGMLPAVTTKRIAQLGQPRARRGCSPDCPASGGHSKVSPAHTGMLLDRPPHTDCPAGQPRARAGDAPQLPASRSMPSMSAPRTRGMFRFSPVLWPVSPSPPHAGGECSAAAHVGSLVGSDGVAPAVIGCRWGEAGDDLRDCRRCGLGVGFAPRA